MTLKSIGSISGITSIDSLYSRSEPSSNVTRSTFGSVAGRRSLSCIRSLIESWTVCSKISPRTASPKRFFSIAKGTFPGRNPGTFTVPPTSVRRVFMRPSIFSLGITIAYSRFRPSLMVSVTCINLSFHHHSGDIKNNPEHATFWCGRRDSNPHGLRHRYLKPACLPIPPRPLVWGDTNNRGTHVRQPKLSIGRGLHQSAASSNGQVVINQPPRRRTQARAAASSIAQLSIP